MSFKLSRSQFLQVFAVMQSIKLINGHTSNGAAPRILWAATILTECNSPRCLV